MKPRSEARHNKCGAWYQGYICEFPPGGNMVQEHRAHAAIMLSRSMLNAYPCPRPYSPQYHHHCTLTIRRNTCHIPFPTICCTFPIKKRQWLEKVLIAHNGRGRNSLTERLHARNATPKWAFEIKAHNGKPSSHGQHHCN